jgi:hypothetical protein
MDERDDPVEEIIDGKVSLALKWIQLKRKDVKM